MLAAVGTTWPGTDVQRCTVHKERNLLEHAPRHARDEVKADYPPDRRGGERVRARTAWQRFVRKWRKPLPAVVRSLGQGGDELLTFLRYPQEPAGQRSG